MGLEQELAGLRKPLLRFAMMQLRNDAAAEDAVSATMLAILEKPAAFGGASSLRTYATGILKHKVVDAMRRHGREVQIDAGEDGSIDDALDALFLEDGHWREKPTAWCAPEQLLEEREFIETVQRCIERLPARLASVFMLREWHDQDTDEVCKELGITANNCHVMLFRSRMILRECLQKTWFQPQGRT